MSSYWQRLIVALDSESREKNKEVAKSLSSLPVKYKIGSIAFTKFGPSFVKEFIDQEKDIFLDLKLYDIPNTMAKTASVISSLGCWAFTVHLKAGKNALAFVKEEVLTTAKALNKRAPLILGVTELTSSSLGKDKREEAIEELALCAEQAGIDGVIASGLDVKKIKQKHSQLKVITPGIRNPLDKLEDQVSITTAKDAFINGADYIVVGRPIIAKENYLEAAKAVLGDLV